MPSDPERRARGAQKLGEILGQTPDQSPVPDKRTRRIVTACREVFADADNK